MTKYLNKNFYDAVLSAVKKVWNTENAVATVGGITLKFNQGIKFDYPYKEIIVKGYGRYWRHYCYDSYGYHPQKRTVAKWICRDFDETGRCYAETDEPYDYWNTK